MNKELFGVFGDRARFEALATSARFDRIVEADGATVGIRDVGLGIPGRSGVFEGESGSCVIWGEAFPPDESTTSAAEWLFRTYATDGDDALDRLNGSYLAFLETDDESFVATDPIRSWDCYYTDAPGTRVFGTDAARVARTIRNPARDPVSFAEMAHFGVVFEDRTVLRELSRAPFDGYVGRETTGTLERFVYDPQTFDYVDELAARLRRAIRRRSRYPGATGLLSSAGYDSRIILSQLPDVDTSYTLGAPETDEVRVARAIANQYGVDHRTLVVDGSYLDTAPEVVQYAQGIRESLQIHHRGNNDEIDADTIYHGLLFDTLLQGWFLPKDGIELFDHTFPLSRLDPDPDVPAHFGRMLGFLPDSGTLLERCPGIESDDTESFLREKIVPQFERCTDRAATTYDAMALLGIELNPTLPFRTHLADHYIESFVATDRELIDWHLTTPPEHRNVETYLAAIQQLDGDILRHRPPDRPHHSHKLNQVHKFLRRKLPGVRPFETPWPDRDEIYVANGLDEKLFPAQTDVRALPPRIKLRVNDVIAWVELATGSPCTPNEVICPA